MSFEFLKHEFSAAPSYAGVRNDDAEKYIPPPTTTTTTTTTTTETPVTKPTREDQPESVEVPAIRDDTVTTTESVTETFTEEATESVTERDADSSEEQSTLLVGVYPAATTESTGVSSTLMLTYSVLRV